MAHNEPLRGHHVINNGVRKALPSIIDDFLKKRGKRFDDLTLDATHSVWTAHEQPLTQEDLKEIDKMTATTPAKQQHVDQNDQEYGIVTGQLRTAVVTCMDYLLEEFESGEATKNKGVEKQFFIIAGLVERLNAIDNEIYVDRQALGWWRDNGGDMAVYRSVRDNVAEMFKKLTNRSELLIWIAELQSALK